MSLSPREYIPAQHSPEKVYLWSWNVLEAKLSLSLQVFQMAEVMEALGTTGGSSLTAASLHSSHPQEPIEHDWPVFPHR